jgi:O-antigen/teichoic acid export membrane protein
LQSVGPAEKNQPKPRSSLGQSTIYNILGDALPMVVAVWAIQVLVRRLGTDRFGLLTIAWAVVGYFSLFDLGLGRALTKMVAERVGTDQHDEVPAIVWTGLAAMIALGLLGTFPVLLSGGWLVRSGLHVSGPLADEATVVFRLLALSVPLVTVGAGLRGALEAYQQFGVLNLVKLPMGVLVYASSVVACTWSSSLVPVVAVLVILRALNVAVMTVLCLWKAPNIRRRIAIDVSILGPMLRFGGWLTVSNVIAPLLAYLDRLVLGFLVGDTRANTKGIAATSAVAYYAMPFEVVVKILIIPGALLGVLFPAFASDIHTDPERSRRIYRRALSYLYALIFPIVLLVVTLAPDAMTLWLGAEFSAHSARIAQILAVGVFLCSLAGVPMTLVQSAGKPRQTAILHIIELFLYVPCLWLVASHFGIVGAALLWTVRVAADAVALFALAHRIVIVPRRDLAVSLATVGASIGILCIGGSLTTTWVRVVFALAGTALFSTLAWRYILADDDRQSLLRRIARAQPSKV